jgi:hypothetical protein
MKFQDKLHLFLIRDKFSSEEENLVNNMKEIKEDIMNSNGIDWTELISEVRSILDDPDFTGILRDELIEVLNVMETQMEMRPPISHNMGVSEQEREFIEYIKMLKYNINSCDGIDWSMAIMEVKSILNIAPYCNGEVDRLRMYITDSVRNELEDVLRVMEMKMGIHPPTPPESHL